MIRRFLIPFVLTATAYAQTTPTSMTVSPHGATIVAGTSLTFTTACTYASHASDDCTFAGGVTWSTPTTAGSITSGGVFTWNIAFLPTNGTLFPAGYWTARGIAHAVVTSFPTFSDTAEMQAQVSGDKFNVFLTPNPTLSDPQSGASITPTPVVGARAAFGAGFTVNHTGNANPFQETCNWASSNPSIATVDPKTGLATAIAVGSVTITCGQAGNGTIDNTVSGAGLTRSFTVINPTITSQTWYVRPNGGTPYVSAGVTPAGQCDGKHDADYPGTGVNQACAMANLNMLFYNYVTGSNDHWMIGSGDTVIVRAKTGGYQMGLSQLSPAFGGTATVPINCGNPDCWMPSIPSGTATHHTQILAECDTGAGGSGCIANSSKVELVGSWSELAIINVQNSDFVDVKGFTLSQHGACARNNAYTNACPNNGNYGRFGVVTTAWADHLLFQDIFIDGMAQDAWHGPTASSDVVLNRVEIRGSSGGGAGINMDDGAGGFDGISTAGGFTLTNSKIWFTGCVEEFPIVHTYPFIECRGSGQGSEGDALGTGSTTGDWFFDHDTWMYNYQDGMDLLHSGLQNLTVTNNFCQGNAGNCYKIGSGVNVTVLNNVANVNCNRLLQTVGDEPASAIIPGVDNCRAGGGAFTFNTTSYSNLLVGSNSIAGNADTAVGISGVLGYDNISTINSKYVDNAMYGMTDTGFNGNQAMATFCASSSCSPTPGFYPPLIGWAVRTNNRYVGVRSCPTMSTGETCTTGYGTSIMVGPITSPLTLGVTEPNFDPINQIAAGTALGTGTIYTGQLTVDMNGVTNPSPPNIGALNVPGAVTLVSITVLPNPGSVVTSSTINFQTSSFCTFSDSSTIAAGSAGCVVVWTTTGAHSTINSSTGIATGVSAGSDTITATLSPATPGTATLNVTALPPPSAGTLVIGIHLLVPIL